MTMTLISKSYDELTDLSSAMDADNVFGHGPNLDEYVQKHCSFYFNEETCQMIVHNRVLRHSEVGYWVYNVFKQAGIKSTIDYKREYACAGSHSVTRFRFRDYEVMTMARLAV